MDVIINVYVCVKYDEKITEYVMVILRSDHTFPGLLYTTTVMYAKQLVVQFLTETRLSVWNFHPTKCKHLGFYEVLSEICKRAIV